MISYLDKLVLSSYTLSNQATDKAQDWLGNEVLSIKGNMYQFQCAKC